MGPVERAVRQHVTRGGELNTPGHAKPFEVGELRDDALVLLLGKGRWSTPVPWQALEEVPHLLAGHGWVRTTGSFAPEEDTTTLSGHLKQYVYRETANWVAVVLEAAGILELDRSRPVTARLREDFTHEGRADVP